MKRTLISMIFCVPMLALAAEQECSPAVPAAAVADALVPVTAATAPSTDPAAETDLAPVTDLALDAQATAANQAPEAVEATAATLGGVATPLPCVAVAPAPAVEPAYVPKTEHDNSPWRFDMNQNGKRMSAAEFDAWMKAKGIRVATGRPGGAQAPQVAVADPSLADPSVVDPTVAPASDVPALVPVADPLPVTPSSEALPAPAPALGAK